jgi:hypothetical protein
MEFWKAFFVEKIEVKSDFSSKDFTFAIIKK